MYLKLCIALYCLGDQLLIHQHTTVIDFLIEPVKCLLLFGYRKIAQLVSDLALRIYIPDTVSLKLLPLFWSISWPITSPHAIGFGGLARHGEEPDQVGSLFQLFPLDVQHLAHAVQGEGEGQHSGLDGCTLPPFWRKLVSKVMGQAGAFKGGIKGRFDDGRVLQSREHPVWELLSTSQIDHLCFLIVESIGKEEYLKVRTIGIGIDPAFCEVHI